jgi:hypothetical protein
MRMTIKGALIIGVICLAAIPTTWGCGDKQPSQAEQKKELSGEPGKKFDPSSVPPQYRAGFEKWKNGIQSKVSGPVEVTGAK